MLLSPQRSTGTSAPPTPHRDDRPSGAPPRGGWPGFLPWAAALAVAVAVAGAALSFNGVLRGWAWYSPVFSTVLAVAFAQASLRALRQRTLVVTGGGAATLVLVLTFIFFRKQSIAGFIPSPETVAQLGKFLRRASETVLAESSPVAPNSGIVMVICAFLGLMVILVDALAFPLGLPATSGLGIVAVLLVPALIKPQGVGVLGFVGAAAGYLLVLGCSHWYSPDRRLRGDTAPNAGQFGRATITGAAALALSLLIPLAIPGFDRGTFPEGSRLNPFGTAGGLNPMISLGNNLRSSSGTGRITYATNAPAIPYLRTVTVDNFAGDAWAPDDRQGSRRLGTESIESGLNPAAAQRRVVTVLDAGQVTSPYLPVPYAPESISGLTGRWSWDPDTLSVKGIDTNSYDQQYMVLSVTAELTPELLAQSSASPTGILDQFSVRPPNTPDIVRQTADAVTAPAGTQYDKAMALQRYLRSGEFTYSLQSPVRGGYDGNGLSVLADFLTQKSGYCIHFAAAMAVMARLKGIPSRIAVGYAPGRPTGASISIPGQGTLAEYEVDSRDAHAWPELYFEGLGWVAFEPTPSRGVVPAYAAESPAAGGASTNQANEGQLPQRRPDTAPAPAPVPVPPPAPGTEGPAGSDSVPPVYFAVTLLVLVLLAGSPRLARTWWRRRRLGSAADNKPALQAWAELRDLATDYGLPPRASETARNYSERLRNTALGPPEGTGAAAHAAVDLLTKGFERQEYGRPVEGGGAPGSGAAERIALVKDALVANAKPWVRFRAAWLPPSVLSGWRSSARSAARAMAGVPRWTRRAAADTWLRIRDAFRRARRD